MKLIWKSETKEKKRKAGAKRMFITFQKRHLWCVRVQPRKMTDNGLKINLTFGEKSKTSVLKAQGEKK